MSVLVVPGVFGLGTQLAESLQSVIWRTAAVYRVKPPLVSALVARVGRNSPHLKGASTAANGFISCSDTSRWLTSGLELLSGRTDITCSTLLKLRPVLGPRARGIVARNYRLCPMCLDPNDGMSYGLFAHQMLHVQHCPAHGVALLEQCQRCRKPFLKRLGPAHRHCETCSAPLWRQRAKPQKLSPYSAWSERQALEVVAFASRPDTAVPADWGELYSHALINLYDGLDHRYTRAERIFVHNLIETRSALSTANPGMKSLLRLASIQATSLVEFIQAPVELSSPRLFNIGGAKDPYTGRRTYPIENWLAVKAALEKLLATEEYVVLPSKRKIVRETGLAVSGLWQHFPELAVNYQLERKRRALLAAGKAYRRIFEGALAIVRSRQRKGLTVHVRRDGAELRKSLNAPKHVAEQALHAAIASNGILAELSTQVV